MDLKQRGNLCGNEFKIIHVSPFRKLLITIYIEATANESQALYQQE